MSTSDPPLNRLRHDRLSTAMREVARCCGTRRTALGDSRFWARLRGGIDAVAGHPEGRQLADAASRVGARSAAVRLEYGAWHGDWAPWNMATLDRTLLVWDWERFTPDVPLGFDALHHELQRTLVASTRRDDPRSAVHAMLERAPTLLTPFGITQPDAADTTGLLYLLDLAARYLADRQAEAGARLGVLGTWLLPALLDRVERR